MRKIIQIATDPKGRVIALASDGSVWVKEDDWVRIKDLPQPGPGTVESSKAIATEALKRILKKSPNKVGRAEAADMSIEFQAEANIALAALER